MKINQVLIEADPPVDLGAGMARAWQNAWMKQNPGSNREQALYAAQQMAVSNPDALTKKFDANTAVTIDQMMAATEFDNPKDYKGPIGNVAGSEVDDTDGETPGVLAGGPDETEGNLLSRNDSATDDETSADDNLLAKMKANAGLGDSATDDESSADDNMNFRRDDRGVSLGSDVDAATDLMTKGGKDSIRVDDPTFINQVDTFQDMPGISKTGNKEVTAVDDFSGMPGTSATGNKEVTAVDDFSGTALAKPKASINYAGGDPDVDATATAAAPTKRVAAGTGAGGPANRYAKPKGAISIGANDRKQAMPAKTATQTARAADPNALKNKAAFMNTTSPREGGPLKKAGSNIGKAITSVTKQTGGREGSSFGDGSNPKVGNLLAKGTKMKTDADLGIAPSPDRGDFNPAAAPKPKADAAKAAAAARNRAANAEREKREMNRDR